MWGKKDIAKAARELADHLEMAQHIKVLQQGQKEIVDAMATLNKRLNDIDSSLQAIKAETKLDAIKETQAMLNAVQGGFYEKLQGLAISVSNIERDIANGDQPSLPDKPLIQIPKIKRASSTDGTAG